LDVAKRLGLAGDREVDAAKGQLRVIVAMLVVLGKNRESPSS
jgi:hypothetical protein